MESLGKMPDILHYSALELYVSKLLRMMLVKEAVYSRCRYIFHEKDVHFLKFFAGVFADCDLPSERAANRH